MAYKIDPIARVVNECAERMGIGNSFSVYLDERGKEFEPSSRGKLDHVGKRIVLNGDELYQETFNEDVASVVAFFQPPAYMFDCAYRSTELDEIRAGVEDINSIVESSVLLPGICKKVEYDIMGRLKDEYRYNFAGEHDESMDWKSMEKDKGRELTIDARKGFNLYANLQRAAEKAGHERSGELLRACLITACESGSFDRTFEKLLNGLDYSIASASQLYDAVDGIFVAARLRYSKMPNIVNDLGDLVNKGFIILGKSDHVHVSDILPNMTLLYEQMIKSGTGPKTAIGFRDKMDIMKLKSQTAILSQKDRDDIREMYSDTETWAEQPRKSRHLELK